MSGSSGARPTSRSPGGQRRKLDTDSRGRDKTKAQAPHNNRGAQSPGSSKSGARECWECNEVVTGDHYQHNCPKKKKKEDESRPMTPYPRRDGSNSKDKSSATQGNETFRRFHGYLGTEPWKILVQGEAAPKPESKDEPEPEQESAPEPEPESEPETETESVVEPEFTAGPESECAPEPESTAEAAEGSAFIHPDATGTHGRYNSNSTS